MSLPSQTVALLRAARDLVKTLPADAVLVLTETSIDWDEVGRLLGGCRLFVAAENPALTKPLRDHPDWTVIDLDQEPRPTQERMNDALRRATLVLATLPDGSEDGDEGLMPGRMDYAVPGSTGSQRLAPSSARP